VHDLVLAADVFIYIGELDAVFETCARILRSSGWLLFSVETASGDSWGLCASGRFGHSIAYIERLAAAYGFSVTGQRHTSIRNEFLRPVPGLLFLLRKEC
jgi:predicted TPR repeat methyltransferase